MRNKGFLHTELLNLLVWRMVCGILTGNTGRMRKRASMPLPCNRSGLSIEYAQDVGLLGDALMDAKISVVLSHSLLYPNIVCEGTFPIGLYVDKNLGVVRR